MYLWKLPDIPQNQSRTSSTGLCQSINTFTSTILIVSFSYTFMSKNPNYPFNRITAMHLLNILQARIARTKKLELPCISRKVPGPNSGESMPATPQKYLPVSSAVVCVILRWHDLTKLLISTTTRPSFILPQL